MLLRFSTAISRLSCGMICFLLQVRSFFHSMRSRDSRYPSHPISQ
jgi:hypothetical protein